MLQTLPFLKSLVAMVDVGVLKVAYFYFEFKPGWIHVEGTETDAGHFKSTVGFKQEIEALGVDGMRSYNLTKWRLKAALTQVLEILEVTDLTRDL